MHILMVLPRYALAGEPPARGGVARSGQRIVSGLRGRGHRVDVCAPCHALFPGVIRRDVEDAVAGSVCVRFGAQGEPDLLAWADRVRAQCRESMPDVVFGMYGTQGGFVAVSVARELGIRSLVALRGNDVDRDFYTASRLPLLEFAVRRADAVTTVSREMARKVEGWFGVEARFVSNSIAEDGVFRPDPEGAAALRAAWGLEDRRVIGLFGDIKPKRGLDRLSRVLASCDADWQLVVVGHVRPESRGDLPEGVLLREHIDDLDVLRAAYNLCDGVAQPSHHDGMPNVVLEAMACARTVVASPVGGLVDLIEPDVTGLLCDTDDAWVQTLSALHHTPRPELGVRARSALPSVEDELDAFEDMLRP